MPELKHYTAPATGLRQLQELLPDAYSLQGCPGHRLQRRWLDSFDLRLEQAGLRCQLQQEGGVSELLLISREDGKVLAASSVAGPPLLARDLPEGPLRDLLEPLLEVRALLEQADLETRVTPARICDRRGKTVARIQLETPFGEGLPSFLTLTPLRGYRKQARRIDRRLRRAEGVEVLAGELLDTLLQWRGYCLYRPPAGLSGVVLEPEMAANEALARLLLGLLAVMKANEAGILADLDSEFLHDFRVSLRRSRSLLGQVRGVFEERDLNRFGRELAWLAGATSDKRDFDVFLLQFDQRASLIGRGDRPALEPLRRYLEQQRTLAQGRLRRTLESRRYARFRQAWREWLEQQAAQPARPPTALESFSENTWRVYRKVLREGGAIDDSSPVEALHELRKSCKKLRYLMEAGRSLYPPKRIRRAIAELKLLQDTLGAITDLDVQRSLLLRWEQVLAKRGIPEETIAAIEALRGVLGRQERKARKRFARTFERFSERANRKRYRRLFRS
ncbi:MAG: CHAD domain-containing protein [Gammaproteobacteria bacterium]|nr:MAG: CHAD domain-containing protein [Gammaproteobacteria bacterium]